MTAEGRAAALLLERAAAARADVPQAVAFPARAQVRELLGVARSTATASRAWRPGCARTRPPAAPCWSAAHRDEEVAAYGPGRVLRLEAGRVVDRA